MRINESFSPESCQPRRGLSFERLWREERDLERPETSTTPPSTSSPSCPTVFQDPES